MDTAEFIPEFLEFELPADCKKPNIIDWEPVKYQFDNLIALKGKLNDAKNRLDPIHENRKDADKYQKITAITYVGEDLRGKAGVLSKEYNAQFVTKAWMKIHEIFIKYVPLEQIIKRKISSRKTAEIIVPRKDLYTFHIAEAPGAFLPSINHIIGTKFSSIDWNWFAESYRDPIIPYGIKGTKYLGDQYGLMRKYNKKWIYGAEGDGDITKGSNLRWFKHHIGEHFPRLDVITSDVKFVPTDDFSFEEEEVYNIPVHVGHTIASLVTLSKGGIAILKTFTFFESASVSLLYLLSCSFEKVLITKPMTSTPANSETYIVCIGFLNNISKTQIDILYNYLDYCRAHPRKAPALFPKSSIPKKFIEKLTEINKELMERQIKYIDRNIDLYNKYKDEDYDKLEKDAQILRNAFAEKWLNEYKMEPISESQLL